jgi:formate/nitrite transporter FocA (FNT family)
VATPIGVILHPMSGEPEWHRSPISRVLAGAAGCGVMVRVVVYFAVARDAVASTVVGVITAVAMFVMMEWQYRRHGV